MPFGEVTVKVCGVAMAMLPGQAGCLTRRPNGQWYKNAIDDQLANAISVLDPFHLVKLGGQAVDEVRRRVQQAKNGLRGRKSDPLYGIRNLLRCGQEWLTDRQQIRLAKAIDAYERHLEVFVAWQCAQQLRQVYHQTSSAEGRRLATKIIDSFPSCPIPR